MRGTWVGLVFLCAMQAVAQAPVASAGSGGPVSIRDQYGDAWAGYFPAADSLVAAELG